MALESTQPLVKTSIFLVVKAAGAWGWRPHHPHVPNVMKIWEPKTPGTLWATPGLLRDSSFFSTTTSTTTTDLNNYLLNYLLTYYLIIYLVTYLFTAIELSPGGSSPYSSKKKQ
jgi:hypothetical protein